MFRRVLSSTICLIAVFAIALTLGPLPIGRVSANASQPQPTGTNFVWVNPTTSSPYPDNYHGKFDQISYDGRYVVYQSISSDLISGDTNSAYDIFVKDNQTNQTERVSVDNSGSQLTGNSANPVMSSNGRYVAYTHKDSNNIQQVYVRDRTASTTTLVSSDASGNASDVAVTPLSVTDAGLVLEGVSSCSTSTVLPSATSANCLYLKTLSTGAIQVLPFVDPTGSGHSWALSNSLAALSSDGSTALVYGFDSTSNYRKSGVAINQIVAINLSAGTSQIVSTPASGNPTDFVHIFQNGTAGAGISRNGRYVVFTSHGPNLLSGSVTAFVYMRDLQTGTLTAIDKAPTGRTNNGYENNTSNAMVSDNGQYVGFGSTATNLANSYNPTNAGTGNQSLYVRDTVNNTTTMQVNQITVDGAYAPGSNTFAFASWDGLANTDTDYLDVYQTYPN